MNGPGMDGSAGSEPDSRETRAVRAPARRVWAALTEPDELRHWWGALAPPLREGKLSRLDLGDGDVDTLEVFGLEPPHRLAYRRRLFGVDTKETVDWRITPAADGCLVGVTWSTPEPADDRPAGGYERWRDRLDRLEHFLDGRPAAPAPPDREFLLGTELPGHPDAVRVRLTEFLTESLHLTGIPGHGTIAGDVRIRIDGGDPLTAVLEHPAWAAPTSARIVLLARGQGTKLVIRHRGWAATAYDAAERRRQRVRFAGLWHRLLLRFTLAYARSWRIPTLTAVDLHDRMAREDLVVLDANRTTLWERGHLPRAVFVGQEDLPLDRLPAEKDARLVFYCRDSMCLTAYLSAAKARTLGYPNTYVMEGGREAWADAGLPLVAENPAGVIEREKADG